MSEISKYAASRVEDGVTTLLRMAWTCYEYHRGEGSQWKQKTTAKLDMAWVGCSRVIVQLQNPNPFQTCDVAPSFSMRYLMYKKRLNKMENNTLYKFDVTLAKTTFDSSMDGIRMPNLG